MQRLVSVVAGKKVGDVAAITVEEFEDGGACWAILCDGFSVNSESRFDSQEIAMASALEHSSALFGDGKVPHATRLKIDDLEDKQESQWDKLAKDLIN